MRRMVSRWSPWVLLGLSVGGYVLTLALLAVTSLPGYVQLTAVVSAWLAYVVVGALVASRRPENAVGWVLIAMGMSGSFLGLADAVAAFAAYRPDLVPRLLIDPWVLGLFLNLWVVSFALIPVLLLLFPTGRPPSARWRPVMWITGILIVVGLITSGSAESPAEARFPLLRTLFGEEMAAPLIEEGQGVVGIGVMVLAALGVASLVLRLTRASGVERQQLKWFVFAGALFAVVYVVTSVSFFVPALRALDPDVTIPVAMFGGIPFILALTLLPISVGIAILRYRLYDIDLLINRSLVYGALTASLGAAYVATVLVLQTGLRSITAGSDIAVAISTLAVVALFQPLRRRFQDAVDRRFYRARYDARRTVDAFAERLRDEVDVDDLRRELIAAVDRTVRPAHASVWLRWREGAG